MTPKDSVSRPAWHVRCFEKDGDRLLFDIPVYGVELGWLQQLFDVPKEDPMYDSFPVSSDLAEKLEPFSLAKIDTDQYDCFLELIPEDYRVG